VNRFCFIGSVFTLFAKVLNFGLALLKDTRLKGAFYPHPYVSYAHVDVSGIKQESPVNEQGSYLFVSGLAVYIAISGTKIFKFDVRK
jgi:hypothetical protein